MLDNKGFDIWAGEYDESIPKLSQGYPFEGYYEVLSYVQSQIKILDETTILDIGVGTGLLTFELYKQGGQIFGIDFSKEMIKRAKERMQKATFYLHNFKHGLPKELNQQKFDYIVSSYAIHHLEDEDKVNFFNQLIKHLKDGGKIIIADIAFKTRKDLEEISNQSGDNWDNDEVYFVADELIERLKSNFITEYKQISSCAGVLNLY